MFAYLKVNDVSLFIMESALFIPENSLGAVLICLWDRY
jgi:hypothetical protein